MSTSENAQLKEIYEQRKRLRDERRRAIRFNTVFIVTLILVGLIVIVTGALYIVKNSPDHRLIVFRDRKAPVVTVHDAISANGKTFSINDFVDNIEDISNVDMTYISQPDYTKDGIQDIVIRFTDEAGNYVDKSLKLEVFHDTSAPVIEGEDEIKVYWNETISYKSFVEVYDDMDEVVDLEIDNSNVDVTKIGDYQVIYTATDSVGNSSTHVMTVHVMEPDTDEYYLMRAYELCDAIIAKIITDDMDDLHKVWAVYNYVREIPYVPTDYTRNYIREGYKMLKENQGDCYGSYASVRLLLDRLDILNIPIQTDENYTRHFWNMVSLDDGITWYHVDATHWTEWRVVPNMCMISDTRLNEISAQHGGTHIHIVEDYPATPYNSMPVPADISEKYGVYDWS